MGCKIDDRNIPQSLDAFGGFDAVHGAGQADVHQDEVRSQVFRSLYGVFAVGADADGVVSRPFQLAGQIRRDHRFIFNDENVRLRH